MDAPREDSDGKILFWGIAFLALLVFTVPALTYERTAVVTGYHEEVVTNQMGDVKGSVMRPDYKYVDEMPEEIEFVRTFWPLFIGGLIFTGYKGLTT